MRLERSRQTEMLESMRIQESEREGEEDTGLCCNIRNILQFRSASCRRVKTLVSLHSRRLERRRGLEKYCHVFIPCLRLFGLRATDHFCRMEAKIEDRIPRLLTVDFHREMNNIFCSVGNSCNSSFFLYLFLPCAKALTGESQIAK